ncbi:hypothetical protein roselon_02321 [Roseibacterium elongatum DSM 19469]|uniref:Uncharacterized protein n=1 Tax=Roseicyclus elongatus DSM 19469 TaxID=1294273 RepID=W8S6W2_9RHOB|nr:hypothetical protein [Roseibacterium elongatum]AHM04656.1 hypothetical protein roselon_02321 [Roseibacterium elongatum DSM 19469]
MGLPRLGAAHQTRLSFMRVLLRGLRRQGWQVDRPLWEIDARGVGRAVYRANGPDGAFSLVAFAHDLPEKMRSDRVIAEAWDATFALVDGTPGTADLDRLAANVPLQEAGRVSDRELVLSRANRSVRLWDHVVSRLAAGRQPDPDRIDAVGYLMRTTAVYGSGKFGAADFGALRGRGLLDGPFRAEMLTVWLIRAFVMDLVEHLAAAQGGAGAARLDPALRRRFGIGNSTGLGMAPFLVNHPALLDAWITARETALSRVRALPEADEGTRAAFEGAVRRVRGTLDQWPSAHPVQRGKIDDLRRDLARLTAHLAAGCLVSPHPWEALWRWAEGGLSLEGQELVVALMIEPHGAVVDDLAETMGADEMAGFPIDGAETVGALSRLLRAQYGWALDANPARPEARARFWYVSAAKREPRLGERARDAGAALQDPMDMAHRAVALAAALDSVAPEMSVGDFLATRPQHRRILRRVQMARAAPYAEIRGNLLAADMVPIDMLRLKLAFFGATRFDPRSDRWVRITMYQNAPFPDELHDLPEDDWAYPPIRQAVSDPVS